MPGDTRLDIPVTIVDDSDFEDQEQFLGRLSTSNPNAVIDVPTTQVFIDDNNRKFLLLGTVCSTVGPRLADTPQRWTPAI